MGAFSKAFQNFFSYAFFSLGGLGEWEVNMIISWGLLLAFKRMGGNELLEGKLGRRKRENKIISLYE